MPTDLPTVVIRYSCKECGIDRRELTVLARGQENVVEWLEGPCIHAIAWDHRKLSPDCQATEISDLMIPVAGDKVGGAVTH